jgi:hypothetical protein
MTNLEALKLTHSIRRKLMEIDQAIEIRELEERGESENMVDPKVAALITEFDTATDKIAARIQKLIDAGGLSDESKTALQAEVDKLNLLGQDPANPVPPTVA